MITLPAFEWQGLKEGLVYGSGKIAQDSISWCGPIPLVIVVMVGTILFQTELTEGGGNGWGQISHANW